MSDRALLKAAAQAAGYDFPAGQDECDELVVVTDAGWQSWNPLTDDGDAFRLAVKLRLIVYVWDEGDWVSCAKSLPDGEEPDSATGIWFAEPSFGDLAAATRKSIVQTAAAIARKSNE